MTRQQPLEIWRQLADFEDYEISNLGRVLGVKRGKVLKDRRTKLGYKIVDLPVGGKKYKTFYVHHLVAKEFVPNPDPVKNTTIIFLDGVKSNARANNLQWATKSYARSYAYDNLTIPKTRLERNEAEFASGKVNQAVLNEKRLYYKYNGIYYKVHDTNSSLGIFVKTNEGDWKFISLADIILSSTVGSRPSDKHFVGYRDMDYYNVSPLNLLWETLQEKYKRQLEFDPVGKLMTLANRNYRTFESTITDTDKEKILRFHNKGVSYKRLGQLFNCHPNTVSRYIARWKKEEEEEEEKTKGDE